MASLFMQAQLGFSQAMTNVNGAVVSGQPRPTGGGTTTTGTGTTPGTPRTGGTTTGTGTRPGGVKTTGTNPQSATDIPVVPLGTTEQQIPTTTGSTDNNGNTTLVCDQDKCAATVQKTLGNEVIVMTVLFLGSLVGGILWILGLLLMKKGVIEREGKRMDRENRHHLQQILTSQKTKMYDQYINSVMNIVDHLQHKRTFAGQELAAFNDSSVFISLHGSQHLRAMNDHVTGLMNSGKPLSTADKLHLQSELSKTIKADLA